MRTWGPSSAVDSAQRADLPDEKTRWAGPHTGTPAERAFAVEEWLGASKSESCSPVSWKIGAEGEILGLGGFEIASPSGASMMASSRRSCPDTILAGGRPGLGARSWWRGRPTAEPRGRRSEPPGRSSGEGSPQVQTLSVTDKDGSAERSGSTFRSGIGGASWAAMASCRYRALACSHSWRSAMVWARISCCWQGSCRHSAADR